MTVARLFFDDEGVIARRAWWASSLVLLASFMLIGWMAGFARHGDSLMVFTSIAILIPFHAVNAKRFRAIGRSPLLALWGGVVPALSILTDAFLDWPMADILLGWTIMGIMVWYVIDLGVYPHDDHASQARIDAAAKHA